MASPLTIDRAPALDGEPAPVDSLSRLLGDLSATVLGGADAEELIHRLALLLGLPVTLRDEHLGVRCWAAPAVFRLDAPPALPPDVPALRQATARLGPARRSVVLAPAPAHGLARRHLLAVLVVEGAVAGYLDLAELGRPLTPTDTRVAEQAAAILSVQRLGEVRTTRAVARNHDDVLADLLRGTRPAPDLSRLAAQVGLDPTAGHVLVRCPVRAGRSPGACRGGVAGALGAALGAEPAVLAEPDAVVALVALAGDAGPAGLRTVHGLLREGMDGVAAATGIRRVVVSGPVRDVPGFPAALSETREVDGIAASLGAAAGVVPVTELSTLRLVVSGERTDVAVRFAEQCLGPLRRSDAESGGDLVETLRTYLAAGAQVRAAARVLGVHENTVRYRLGRIEHLTGLDTRRFDALLAAQLAFQVDGLATGGPR
ncbi:helix-turn-helix domain-containing protein [Pseudonocardia sp. C8]|uniref:PucR family transcriptional regulator n=1 Tax=Pseudonocardia sp. C8 TaxID=2762759 RepID=UPI001643669F|nr:PucR family transcriptional regulator [Pseudonocardia sp. C8]MBC3192756.1 helix-turn-helix domain-containing protein [Pseudonocardia sp. C8]